MPSFDAVYASFFDIDGEVGNGGSVYEFVSVPGAETRALAPSSSALEFGSFGGGGSAEAVYVISSQSANVATDFTAVRAARATQT
eukprot:6491850-Prymnesium_polylepis.1